MCGDVSSRRLYTKRSGAVSPSLYAETGYRSQRFADGDYESFGNRKQILKKADELHGLMGDSPYQYVLSCQWEKDFPSGATNSFYRMLSYADFYGYFRRLYIAYTQFESLEEALMLYPGIPMEKLCAFLEVSAKSPQKKLNMFCVG